MNEVFDRLKQRIYITRNARFEAYRRMKRRKLSSTVSLALLSLSIIWFNVLQLCDGFEAYNEAITAVTIMLSVFVLVLSLLVSYLNYSEREHKYYECAMQLSSLYDRLTLEESPITMEQLRRFHREYDQALMQCGVNHINIDNERARSKMAEFAHEFGKWQRRGLWWRWNFLDINTLYWLLAFAIPIIAGIIIFKSQLFALPFCLCGCEG